MKKYLWIHILIEGLGGLILFFYPQFLYFQGTEQLQAFPVIRLYGFIAACFAIVYTFINLSVEEQSKLFLQIYLLAMGFQLFIAFQCYGLLNSGYLEHQGAFFVHLAAFVVLSIGYFIHRFDKA